MHRPQIVSTHHSTQHVMQVACCMLTDYPPAVCAASQCLRSGRRVFSVAGLKAWNLLLDSARDLTHSFNSLQRNLTMSPFSVYQRTQCTRGFEITCYTSLQLALTGRCDQNISG